MSRTVKIDKAKFDTALQKRGLNKASMSRELGRTDSYISQICNVGAMPVGTLKMIDVLYNIKAEEITLDKTPDNNEASVPNKELYDTIYKAITDAFVWYANQGR